LFNWKKISLEGGQTLYEGPEGELFEDLQQAYEHTVAAKTSQTGFSESKVGLSFLQKFLNNCCSEEQEMLIDDARIMITTSTMEDIEHKI
jgi:hypothetical protein